MRRFLCALLVATALTATVSAQYSDFYIMADDDLDFDGFDISGGQAQLPPYTAAMPLPFLQPQQYQYSAPAAAVYTPPTAASTKGPLILPVQTLPLQTSQSAPVTLPIQKSTREVVNLPVLNKQRDGINAQPIVNTQYIEQPQKQYRLVNQEFIQPRLIETPKLQKTHYTQPVYRQIVTQPVIVPRVTSRDIIHQRYVDQPIYQHRLIQSSELQPTMVDVPVTNAPQMQAPVQMPAAEPIVQRENVQANPIYRTAPGITQPMVTQPIQMPAPTPKKGQQALYANANLNLAAPAAANGNGPATQMDAGEY